MDHFCLAGQQFAKIAPNLSTDTQGKERVDDRGMISCIVPVLKSGGRWTDAGGKCNRSEEEPWLRYIHDRHARQKHRRARTSVMYTAALLSPGIVEGQEVGYLP